jgi:hypothetical protein
VEENRRTNPVSNMAPGSKEEGAKYQEKLKQSNEEGNKAQKFRKFT